MQNREVVFVDGMRTAFGRMGGTLKDMIASELAGRALKGLVDKTGITQRAKVDAVFLGSACGCSHSINPARWAVLKAGLGYEVVASYIEMQCGSAIDSINHAAWRILANHADIIIAGGMESYSQMGVKFSMASPPYKLMPPLPINPQLSPAWDEQIGMGITAENLQERYQISREAQDEFAYASQQRTKAAMAKEWFAGDICPVVIPGSRKTPEVSFVVDEHPRPDTTLEAMAKLQPAFKPGGTVTAANSSGQNDGAAFVLMMSRAKCEELGYTPLARWVCGADHGVDPRVMGIAPAYAMPKALQRAGLKLSDIDVLECNEAFAVQNLAVIAEVENLTAEKVDRARWNPNGGAIAYAHPNGASGARICMFTIRELISTGGRYGMFSSCCGGGLGVASLIENLQR